MQRVLAIGNSFSQDATRYLREISEFDHHPIFARNLYIGGCSLERHAENIRLAAPAYEYQADAAPEFEEKVSIPDALLREDWDIVTVQQVSHLAGRPETYAPYLQQVLDEIKRLRPNAEIRFHSTWAYEWGSEHSGFPYYQCDQNVMNDAIQRTTAEISAAYHLPVIPTGLLIQKLREHDCFNVKKGGLSLCRDRFHMSLDYGRYAAGMLWYIMLSGHIPAEAPVLFDNADPELLELIRNTAASLL
jgi:hypothetical protein